MNGLEMHEGCIIGYSSNKHFTKEELIKVIEENFPDDNTFENIAVITTIKSEREKHTFQSLMFGKVIKF